jgi:hypothetical protein
LYDHRLQLADLDETAILAHFHPRQQRLPDQRG